MIWDFAGNAPEWVDRDINIPQVQQAPMACLTNSDAFNHIEFPIFVCAGYGVNDFRPLNASFDSTKGLGLGWISSDVGPGHIVRGGDPVDGLDYAGIYSFYHDTENDFPFDVFQSFRCVYRP